MTLKAIFHLPMSTDRRYCHSHVLHLYPIFVFIPSSFGRPRTTTGALSWSKVLFNVCLSLCALCLSRKVWKREGHEAKSVRILVPRNVFRAKSSPLVFLACFCLATLKRKARTNYFLRFTILRGQIHLQAFEIKILNRTSVNLPFLTQGNFYRPSYNVFLQKMFNVFSNLKLSKYFPVAYAKLAKEINVHQCFSSTFFPLTIHGVIEI